MTDLSDAGILGKQIITEDGKCKCGSDLAIIRAGAAMHRAGLMCAACGQFRQWLSAEVVDGIADLYCAMSRMKIAGRPDGLPLQPDTIRIRTKKLSAPAESAADMGEPAAPSSSTRNAEGKHQVVKVSEAFPSKYLKAADLQGREVQVVMQSCVYERAGKDDKQDTPVLYFRGKAKGLCLNKTNSSVIAAAYGDDSADWHGKPIVLYPANVEFQGKPMLGIRVKLPKDKKPDPISTGPQHDPDLNDEVPF